MFGDVTLRLRFRKFSCLVALAVMLSMCSFHFKLSCIVTPMYFVDVSVVSVCPCNIYLCSMGRFLVVIRRMEHLSGWNMTPILFPSSCSV